MVILGKWKEYTLTLSLKANCLTVSFQSWFESEVYSFDNAGRLWTAMVKNISYRRGLDGKIVAKWTSEAFNHERRWLSKEEARALEEQARLAAVNLYDSVVDGTAQLQNELPAESQQIFQRITAFDHVRVEQDIARYHRVYYPVGILPPDQYMAVVLQATEGCSFNTCTFCTFYRNRPFHIKTPAELSEHIQGVKAFLENGMSLRRTIFLGDANALVVPTPRLLSLFDTIHQHLDVEKLGGIYAFLDGFSGEKKTVEDYQELKKRGLKRVYIGMESGNEELLRFLKKPGKPEDVIQAVNTMKSAGIAVGIIILLGAGGKTYAKGHIQDTIRAINRMKLDLDDIVYFSELIESEGMEYVRDAYQAQLQPLSPEEQLSQADEIERALDFSESGGTPHISRYDIREFVY
jgi:hypothetical protein